jgi:hypothetical protein
MIPNKSQPILKDPEYFKQKSQLNLTNVFKETKQHNYAFLDI